MTYILRDCVWSNASRWHLSEPALQDGTTPYTWDFTKCKRFLKNENLICHETSPGTKTDITFGPFDIPIFNSRAASALKFLEGNTIEFIPIAVQGSNDSFWIANFLIESDLLNETQSRILWWEPEDGRSDKLGKYRMITKAVARSDIEIPPLSRLTKFDVTVVVNDGIKKTIIDHGLTGVNFEKI